MSRATDKVFMTLLVILFSLSAQAQHKGISFQAVLKDPDGNRPSAVGLSITVQILDPVGNCVLREEEHSGVNITDGYLNLVIGSGTASVPVANNPSPILSINQVMDNSKSINGFGCSYTPSQNHARKLRIKATVPRQAGGLDPVIADFNMRAVAYAVNSESLNGKSETDFINVNNTNNVSQANVESIFSRFAKLDGLLNNSNASGNALGVNISGNATSATTATTATNVSGTVAIANGGTGATSAAAARTSLGLGTLATVSPTGTADNTTYLRGDGTWATVAGGAGTLAGDVTGAIGTNKVEKIQGAAVAAATPTDGLMTWNSTLTRWEAVNPPTCTAAKALRWSAVSDSFTCEDITIVKAQISDFPTLGGLAAKGSVDLSSSDAAGVLPVAKGGTGTSNGSVLYPVPAGVPIAFQNSCPTGWTGGDPVRAGATASSVVICSNVADALIPANAVVVMESCPAGWTRLSHVLVGPQPILLRRLNLEVGVRVNYCQAPAVDVGVPQGARLWTQANACPTLWVDQAYAARAAMATVSCPACAVTTPKVCEAPGRVVLNNLVSASGQTTSSGEDLNIFGGAGGATSGAGGNVFISGGAAANGAGGIVKITGGQDATSTNFAAVVLQGTSGDVGIGTTSPGAKLEVAGQVKITGGSPGIGKVLTSDATGLATWETPSGSTPTKIMDLSCGEMAYTSGGGTHNNLNGCTSAPSCPMGYTSIVTYNFRTGATLSGGNYLYNTNYRNLCASGTVAAGTQIKISCGGLFYSNGGQILLQGCTTAPSCPSGYTLVANSEEREASTASTYNGYVANFISFCDKN